MKKNASEKKTERFQLTDSKSGKIDILRGLSIIAVVFIHNTPDGLYQVMCRPFLNFAVATFLFLSGMLSDANKWHPAKRIKKVVIPYIFWTLVYVTLSNFRNPVEIPLDFLKGLITGNSAAIMYYIFLYCELTLLIPLIDKLARSKYKYLGFVISPVEIVFMRLIPLIMKVNFNYYIEIIMSVSCVGWFIFYYLGYLLGNGLLEIRFSTAKIAVMWAFSIALQIAEGYWYMSMGAQNCGTQLKLSSILSNALFVVLAFGFVNSDKTCTNKFLNILGKSSFGIYFSHIAVMTALKQIPYYSEYIIYPFNAILTVLVSLICVLAGRKFLGNKGRYIAL